MLSIILPIHIALGFIALGYAVGIAVRVKTDPSRVAKSSVQRMWLSLGGVIVSGFGLTVVTSASFGRACAAMSSFIAIVTFVHIYQRNTRRKLSLAYYQNHI